MQIRPYRGADEADLLAVWRASMTHDQVSEDLFRTKVRFFGQIRGRAYRWG
jgi:hypothetical protein